MTVSKILLVLVMVFALAATASAVNVNNSNCSQGSNILSSLAVDGTGNVTLTCSTTTTTPCTGSTDGSWGACVGGTATRTVAGYPAGCTGGVALDPTTESCTPTTTPCTSSTDGAWGACVGGTATRTVAGYPAGCTGGVALDPTTESCTVPTGGSGPCAADAVSVPGPLPDGQQSGLGMCTTVGCGVSIAPMGQNHYQLTTTVASSSDIGVTITTNDWKTEQDLFVSSVGQPACTGLKGKHTAGSPPWYNTNSTNNQSVGAMGSWPAGTTLCMTTCNQSNMTGFYGIYWFVQ